MENFFRISALYVPLGLVFACIRGTTLPVTRQLKLPDNRLMYIYALMVFQPEVILYF